MNPPAVETKSTSNRSDLPDDTDYEVVVIGADVGAVSYTHLTLPTPPYV